ncbi:hypothetical protein VVD49_01695 [Uliginosibacterium sp. H3]|uniref:Phage holin family protein n=1 Tax=Uliginosibacterium silvisoli TaxID=3114758 RepID=A0ABU6JXQ1_9RHOO|nr:hypothetical protein [Uliginosibacterium sp. H3]
MMGAELSPDELAALHAHDKPSGDAPGVFDNVRSLGTSLRGLAHDHLRIIALETRLAGQSLVNMIAASVVLAVLLVSAWLMLVAIGVMLMVSGGIGIVFAMLMAIAVNLGIAYVLYQVIIETSRNLGFPATLRSLGGGDSNESPAGKGSP